MPRHRHRCLAFEGLEPRLAPELLVASPLVAVLADPPTDPANPGSPTEPGDPPIDEPTIPVGPAVPA